MENLIGRTLFERFKVISFIASGGMSVVYRVWDLQRNVPLAMKVLHMDLVDDPNALKRFQREARALQKLAHPNIVPFYGLYQEDDMFFLLELLVDGPSLKQILRKKRGETISPSESLIYLKALCSALGYAHSNGVVHCDVKPGNVMVDRSGRIYLTDFGVARHAESTTTTIGSAGTPAYMAPEQILNQPVSAASDVYALGVLLFELLTGRRPFTGIDGTSDSTAGTAAERVRLAHLSQAAPDPRSLAPDIPGPLAECLMQAMSKMPEQRYPSTQAFLDAACAALSVDAAAIPDRLLASAVEEFYQPLGEDSQSAAVQPPKSKQRFKLTRWMIFGIASATLLPLGFCALALFTGLPVLRSITSGPEPSAIPQIYIELTQTQLAEMVMLTQSTQTPLPTFTLEPTHTPPPSSRTRPSSTPRPTATARPNPTRTSPPPEPTRTATQVVYSSHKATITIHNNFPFPLYFYCDGVKLNKENPIPAKRYMWFNTISRGEHKFKLCNAYDTYDCPYEKVVEISDDWEIWVP